jgi:transposase-like protein
MDNQEPIENINLDPLAEKRRENNLRHYNKVKDTLIHCPTCKLDYKRFSWTRHRASRKHFLNLYQEQFGDLANLRKN